ncbi:hypothetical protein D3C85_1803700 [compost metagenome]
MMPMNRCTGLLASLTRASTPIWPAVRTPYDNPKKISQPNRALVSEVLQVMACAIPMTPSPMANSDSLAPCQLSARR